MKRIVLLALLMTSILIYGQESRLSIFDNLIGKTWKASGNWESGNVFKQEITMNYALDRTIIIVNSIGFTDTEQTKLGARNHGIRQFDEPSNKIRFWEFDVFGGLTEGIVFSEGKNIIYQYNYGGSMITDMWEYVNDHTYNFKVGNYIDGAWKQIYLNTQFKASKK